MLNFRTTYGILFIYFFWCHFHEFFIIFSPHNHIHIVIPGYKSLMSHRSYCCSICYKPIQLILITYSNKLFQYINTNFFDPFTFFLFRFIQIYCLLHLHIQTFFRLSNKPLKPFCFSICTNSNY